jgi:hypothetical protein
LKATRKSAGNSLVLPDERCGRSGIETHRVCDIGRITTGCSNAMERLYQGRSPMFHAVPIGQIDLGCAHAGSRQSPPPPRPSRAMGGNQSLVLAVAGAFGRGDTPAEAAARIGSAVAGISSWEDAESLLGAHGCALLAYHLFAQSDVREACRPPEATMGSLRAKYIRSFLQVAEEPSILAALLAALNGAGVLALAIKGLVLGSWLYRDPALRVHSDIDLVIPEAQADMLNTVLVGLGYTLDPIVSAGARLCPPDESLHSNTYLKPGVSVDVRFDALRIFWRPVASHGDPFTRWWDRRQELTIAGVKVPAPGPEDQFMQLARHLSAHGYSRAIWFVDLLLLLCRYGADLDWDLIGREARAHSIHGSLDRTLELLERGYGVGTPAAARRLLRPSWVVRSLYRQVWPDTCALPRRSTEPAKDPIIPQNFYPQGGREFAGLALLLLDRNRRRNVTYLARRLVPPRSWLESLHGDTTRTGSPYLALWRRHWRSFRR